MHCTPEPESLWDKGSTGYEPTVLKHSVTYFNVPVLWTQCPDAPVDIHLVMATDLPQPLPQVALAPTAPQHGTMLPLPPPAMAPRQLIAALQTADADAPINITISSTVTSLLNVSVEQMQDVINSVDANLVTPVMVMQPCYP